MTNIDKRKIDPIINGFLHDYRGRYSQYWVRRFGMIPELPTSYDNSFDIYDLLSWLQRGFKNLLDDFLNLEIEFEEYKNALIELLQHLIPQLIRQYAHSDEFKNLIREMVKGFVKELWFEEAIREYMKEFVNEKWFQDTIREYMKDFVKEQWFEDILREYVKEFTNEKWFADKIETIIKDSNLYKEIWDKLDELESLVNALLGTGTWTTLEKGRDYDIYWHNGYYSRDGSQSDIVVSNDLDVSVQETNSMITVNISAGTTNKIANASMYDCKMRHSSSIEDIPESRIFSIVFKGDYAWMNNPKQATHNTQNSIINLIGITTGRDGSWAAYYGCNRRTNINGSLSGYVHSIVSFADGRNSQFTHYGESVYTTWMNFDYKGVYYKR